MTNVQFTDVYPDGPTGPAVAAGPAVSVVDAGTNTKYPGMPVGASPLSFDRDVTAAGTFDLWAPPVGNKFVVGSAFITTDTAGRVALVDNTDAQGSRIVDGDFPANGGASPNLVPIPYVSKVAGNKLKVVTGITGNVRVRVAGWLEQA